MNKRLYRLDYDKKIFGVCAGLGEYFDIDPVLIRVLWIVFGFSGFGVLVYIVSALVMPKKSIRC